jgi:hypothetical protein
VFSCFAPPQLKAFGCIAQVNLKTKKGWTALMMAARYGHKAAVQVRDISTHLGVGEAHTHLHLIPESWCFDPT